MCVKKNHLFSEVQHIEGTDIVAEKSVWQSGHLLNFYLSHFQYTNLYHLLLSLLYKILPWLSQGQEKRKLTFILISSAVDTENVSERKLKVFQGSKGIFPFTCSSLST